MFKPNFLYRHSASLDVDFLCVDKLELDNGYAVRMKPVHRRFGPYDDTYDTMSIITNEEQWTELPWIS